MILVLPEAVFELCAMEASAFAPLEAGGLFLGRSLQNAEVVVDHMIGAGPAARRSATWLEVDHDWQNERIAELFASGYRGGYIGEWHSHPGAGDAATSRTDRSALKKLAGFPPLRCPDPIMAILFPKGANWQIGAWRIAKRSGWAMLAKPTRVDPVPIVLS